MASAPVLASIFLIISGLLSSKKNFQKFLQDKWNLVFIFSSILMPLLALFQSNFIEPDGSIVPLINNWEKSLTWIGLSNWLPLFFCFIAFQEYVSTEKDRNIFCKLLIAGSFPIIISGFSQFFFQLYGPFEFLNGLIIWFQKPVNPMEGISAVFSNQNYAGAWYCIIFPFSLASFLDNKNSNLNKNICLTFLIFITISLVLTSSRSAWIGLITYIPLLMGISSLIWILPAIFLVSSLILLANGNFVSPDFQLLIRGVLPKWLWLKFASENYTYGLSRIEIWQAAILFILQRPLLGWGAVSFPLLYYSSKKIIIFHSHNLLLEFALSYGIPIAVLIFGTIFLICILSFLKIYVNCNPRKINLYDRAWFSAFVVLLLSQFVDIQYYDGRISFIFWILLAGLKELINSPKTISNYSSEPLPTDQ